MKKIILPLTLGILIIFHTTSCSDYLDTEPITDQIQSATAPIKDAQDAEEKMKTIYSDFGGEYWQLDYFFNGDAQTDIAYAGGDNVQNFQQDEYRILSTNTNVTRDWSYIYLGIDHCNRILNYIDDVSDPALTTDRKAEMKAEAAIFRALYHFHATQLWGEVPIVTLSVISVNSDNFNDVYAQLFPNKKPVSEVYDFIISDLEAAIASAPASNKKSRANKGAAYALLAKVYATKPNPDWAKVNQYCESVTAEGYSLVSDYEFLFDNAHDFNSESIWEADGNAGNIWAWGTFMFKGTDWKKFNTPSNDLVKSFDDNTDAIRKNSSIEFVTSTVNWTDSFWPNNNYPFANKLRLTDGQQNFYLLRYADILLLQAEAKAHLNDLTTAASLVNTVRDRVGLTDISFSSTDDAINKILLERKLELAFEGHRWFDLKRTGKALEILKQQKDGNGNLLSYVNNLNENRLLFPIPQIQLDNNKNLTQNAGY